MTNVVLSYFLLYASMAVVIGLGLFFLYAMFSKQCCHGH